MKQKCVDKIIANLGRQITQDEIDGIKSQLRDTTRYLAGTTKDWDKMSVQDRMMLAANHEKNRIIASAKKEKQRAALQVMAQRKNLDDMEDLVASGRRPYKAIYKILNNADIYNKGLSKQMFSSMMEAIEASSPKWFGLMENRQFANNFIRELYGESTGDMAAKKAADAWVAKADELLQRYNNNGGDVGKLDSWHIPNAHNILNMVKEGREKWVDDVKDLFRSDTFFDDNGDPVTYQKYLDILREGFDTITTGGLNKFEPGKIQPGISSSLAKRRDNKHRVFHFKDANAHIKYNEKYAPKSLFGLLESHVGRMSRDIGLIEQFGPNPESTFNLMHDTAKKSGDGDMVGLSRVRTTDMWAVMSGKTSVLADPSAIKAATFMSNWRNIEVIGKLQRTFISAFIDLPTYYHTAFYNGEGVINTTSHLIHAFGKENKHYAAEAGLVLDSMINGMNTWADATLGNEITKKLANATIKVSYLEGWTDSIRTAAHTQYMAAIGRMSKTDWSQLHDADKARLMQKGITETDWSILRLAQLETKDNVTMMTRQAIESIPEASLEAAGFTQRQAEQANTRLLAFIADEAEFASLGTNLETRAAMTRGTQGGTFNGELIRALAFFKSFPTAMLTRHFERMTEMEHFSKTRYIGTLLTGLMVMGAIQTEIKDLLALRDPRPINTAKFWTAALLQSGGLGFIGDTIYQLGGSMQSVGGTSAATNLASSILGPVIGSALELGDLTLGNAFKAMQQSSEGKPINTHFGAEAVRLIRSHTPFVNLWYLGSAVDHAGIHDLQEFLSPGYLVKMEERAYKNNQQRYFIKPGTTRARAPDMGNMIK